MGAAEVLELLEDLGVVEVFRCSIVKDPYKTPTETSIVSLAGPSCRPELKV